MGEPNDRPRERESGDSSAGDARAKLAQEAAATWAGLQITDLNGNVCRAQPGPGQMPHLPEGRATNGCLYTDTRPNSPGSIPFDTAALYQTALTTSAHIQAQAIRGGKVMHADSGSGVIAGIAPSGDQCLVATVNHNVNVPVPGGTSRLRVEMPNGQRYPATIVQQDRQRDLAWLSVHTGADTSKLCRPAAFAESPSKTGPAMAFGFPLDSSSLYASSLRMAGPLGRGAVAQEGQSRNYLQARGNTFEGMSGGPVFNQFGQVHALIQGGPAGSQARRLTAVTPVTAEDLRRVQQGMR